MRFWLEDPTVLIKDGNYYQFLPSDKMTRVEQLNALSRFFIYFYVLASLFQKEEHIKNIPVLGLFLMIVIYYIHRVDKDKDSKDVDKEVQKRLKQKLRDSEELSMINDDPTLKEGFDKNIKDFEDVDSYDLEVGQYNSDGELVFIKDAGIPKYERNKENYPELTAEEVIKLHSQTCRKPTDENPFMNPTITDYGNGETPVACNADDEDVNEKMELKFGQDLYQDIEDMWFVKNSQRSFYVLPNTKVPNDQDSFAKWCYGTVETCKEDSANCLRYEDLRFKRPYGTTNI